MIELAQNHFCDDSRVQYPAAQQGNLARLRRAGPGLALGY